MDETKRQTGMDEAERVGDEQTPTVEESPTVDATPENSGREQDTALANDTAAKAAALEGERCGTTAKAAALEGERCGTTAKAAALESERCAIAANPGGEDTAATETTETHARPVSDVANLSAEMRELVERMLTEGATFEDIYDAVNERGVPVTLQAIQNCYRGSLELQKRRIQFQVERAEILKASLANPDSADAQLANAAMLTGLQSLSRKDAGMSLRDAVRSTLERRNLMLRRDLLRMKIAREEEEKRFRKTRLAAEVAKLDLTREKIHQLREMLKRQGKSNTLGPEAMEKIQEIYGLLRIPVIPRDVEPCG